MKAARKFIGYTAVILLGFFLTPALFSLGWHVVNGMSVMYQGKKIPVPVGWIVSPQQWSSTAGITMIKVPPTLAGRQSSGNMFLFLEKAPSGLGNPGASDFRWADKVAPAPQSKVERIDFRSRSGHSVCVKSSPAGSSDAEFQCLLYDGQLWATYAGSQAVAGEFLAAFRGN
jgi:hypothetical protein